MVHPLLKPGGAGPALPPEDSNPAGEAQDRIDLVSDTSQSTLMPPVPWRWLNLLTKLLLMLPA